MSAMIRRASFCTVRKGHHFMRSALIAAALFGSALLPAYAQTDSAPTSASTTTSPTAAAKTEKTAAASPTSAQPQSSSHQPSAAPQQQNVAVTGAHIQVSPQNPKVGQAVAVFKNTGSQDLFITSIKTAAADSVSLTPATAASSKSETAKNDADDQNKAQPTPSQTQAQNASQTPNTAAQQPGWKVAAGQSTELSPEKGTVIVLTGIHKTLQAGQQIAFNVTYSDGSQQIVNFTVGQTPAHSLTN